MKTLSVLSTILFVLFSTFSFAQAKKETTQDTIKVWGNCGMCKKTIDKAAKSAGAISADWNDETKLLAVSFASATTNSDKIQQAIAAAGYDTEKFTADQKAYDVLQPCCQYDRKADSPGTGTKTDCCKDGKCAKEGADCCKDGKCAKDQACCKDKSCCKS
ncbi:heavy-metal-associated domain-containing protein [Flavihumibacter fluvii]|uniref:heavy-metal-associated domain-containing protein n=1 Tax=Flavihumibacter fluvii TaxID=2838157 RepID=UPI001BDF487E|nr:heavy-metal-associated domain-containing protein [Flavihumibacter fluvii]ULQ53542.1 hypothetical protein KJS93_04310 [Flavihumibacter fluvii]